MTTLLPADARSAIAAATTRQELLRLATRIGVNAAVVAGYHGHFTGRWNISGSLCGTITDDDIRELEQISEDNQQETSGPAKLPIDRGPPGRMPPVAKPARPLACREPQPVAAKSAATVPSSDPGHRNVVWDVIVGWIVSLFAPRS